MTPDWLTAIAMLVFTAHVATLVYRGMRYCWPTVKEWYRARRATRKIMAALEQQKREDEARAEAYIADEWVLREVVAKVEREAA